MIAKQIEQFGAVQNIILTSDTPNELSAYVNQLFNYGAIANIPDDYDEKKDRNVMVQSAGDKLDKAVLVMAENELLKEKGEDFFAQFKGKKGSEFYAVLRARADEKLAEFKRVTLVYNNPSRAAHEYSQGLIENLGWAQESLITG